MDSAEYERKIASRFATFDQDGSGSIDREDFSAAARAVLAEFGVTARSDKGQAVFAGAEAFWQGMAGIADVDGDQRVSREEFITGAAKRLRDSPDRFAEIARPFLRAVIAVTAPDAARTGATPEAVARVLGVLGTPAELSAQVAAALDGDGDGHVSEDEILAAFSGYCGVEAPDA
ncbi:EF-hand domain-containing protein [Streptomyces goshikiensis]|uniref:EF-hand domain-containing protein n=1 Tax=Streptomyces goshikiensis TaxID=1942 RepID=A0ABZ1RML5_9ACTN|nr:MULTISPECIES: EF-hand domain-containing protein [Streptomyces]AKL66622.1 calcium-binding protein [Streptomyces sp. Mg1]EDX25650.1 calcium binding protein [Streptomyces sp. Mg1]RPK49999.1 EF hand [Streptomyces sp. ADI91-18]WBY20740.1 EF-hand domain-containing protein [Streptomyces goshikiensis]WSR99513.1 EF-hand domain-containing protein [Streptomyces goshikiensis]